MEPATIIAIVTASLALAGSILTPLAISGAFLIKNIKRSSCFKSLEIETRDQPVRDEQ